MTLVKEIQSMRKESRTFGDIAKYLNQKGLTTASGLVFTAGRVQSVLNNEATRTKKTGKANWTKAESIQAIEEHTPAPVTVPAPTPAVTSNTGYSGLLGDIQQLASAPISDETFGRLTRRLLSK